MSDAEVTAVNETEDSLNFKTPFGPISIRGPLVLGVVVLFAGLAVIAYLLHLHDNGASKLLRELMHEHRITNCLLQIPQEERKQTWKLQECIFTNKEWDPLQSRGDSK